MEYSNEERRFSRTAVELSIRSDQQPLFTEVSAPFSSRTRAHAHASARGQQQTTEEQQVKLQLLRESIAKKEAQAIRLIQGYKVVPELLLAYSGGKDSDVMLHLAQKAGVSFTPFYKNTTIDPPYTIWHVKEVGAKIIQPRYNFFSLIEQRGLPNMFRRFCCKELKEQYMGRYVLIGVRRDESTKRAQRYQEPTQCRVYKKDQRTEQIFPLLTWATEEVEQYIIDENIKLHPLYYTEDGIDCTRRLGCMGCPLKGDRGLAEFRQRPALFRAWMRSYDKYGQSHHFLVDLYADLCKHLFYTNHNEHKFDQAFRGLFSVDAKAMLEKKLGYSIP